MHAQKRALRKQQLFLLLLGTNLCFKNLKSLQLPLIKVNLIRLQWVLNYADENTNCFEITISFLARLEDSHFTYSDIKPEGFSNLCIKHTKLHRTNCITPPTKRASAVPANVKRCSLKCDQWQQAEKTDPRDVHNNPPFGWSSLMLCNRSQSGIQDHSFRKELNELLIDTMQKFIFKNGQNSCHVPNVWPNYFVLRQQ